MSNEASIATHPSARRLRRPCRHAATRAGMMALLMLTGCNRRPDSGPVIVSAIGAAPVYVDPDRRLLDTPARLLLDSTAQGLVRFDAAGQIEPGLAERWIVIDGGTSYIFRLREARWTDGGGDGDGDGDAVTADDVVRGLRRAIGRGSRNPLAPFLSAIDEIVAMTPQVIEVRLSRPRPDLLKLFAQPEMALLRLRPAGGSGPFRIVTAGAAPLLRPAFDPGRADPDDRRRTRPEQDVQLIGERAARAIARFSAHRSDLVTGGGFAEWPLLATAEIAPVNIRTDPAAGLFGLSIARREGFLADAANRTAVSQAIDRSAALAAIVPGWEATDRILPDALDSASPPQVPAWSLLTLDQRRAAGRMRVAAWGMPVRLRIAMPPGSGATMLYGRIAASLMAIGIETVRVDARDAADLRLIDRVAPYDSARWYLANACDPCGADAEAGLEAARMAPTLAARARAIALADAALNADVAFIPLARPFRWSLVAARLAQWQPNMRAWHPLNRLRNDPN